MGFKVEKRSETVALIASPGLRLRIPVNPEEFKKDVDQEGFEWEIDCTENGYRISLINLELPSPAGTMSGAVHTRGDGTIGRDRLTVDPFTISALTKEEAINALSNCKASGS